MEVALCDWPLPFVALPSSKTGKNFQVDRKYKDFADDDVDCVLPCGWVR